MMMNAMREGVSSNLDELVHHINFPFTVQVTFCLLSAKFWMPQVETNDGMKDPLDRLKFFKTLIHLQGVLDEIMCKAFPTTLKGPTRVWFNKITPNSISNFMELSGHFVMHFIGGQRYKRSLASLLNIKQREDESLRSYVARFNREVLFIDEADDKMLVTTSPMGYAPENSFSLFTRMT